MDKHNKTASAKESRTKTKEKEYHCSPGKPHG
jgi:hypothetical protein